MLSTPMLGMEAAPHAPLSRTHTAPTSVHARLNSGGGNSMHMNGHQSQYSTYSHASSRSDSTNRSRDTLPTPQPILSPSSSLAQIPSGNIEASDNIINKRGDKELSLFQICLRVKQRLARVPGFDAILLEAEEESVEDESDVTEPVTDPVTFLWRMFRKGYPLMELYNASGPDVMLEVDHAKMKNNPRRIAQASAMKFITACVNQLGFSSEDCFVLNDLLGEDTTGFVKVVRVVNRVIDQLELMQALLPAQVGQTITDTTASTGKRSQREHIIAELVNTERTYVQHLELLQDFKQLVEKKGAINGDAIHDIFLNLNTLLDFQRRFLIRVEQINEQRQEEQNWGKLFVLYKDAFKCYEPYIANQKTSERVAMEQFEKLQDIGGPLEMQQMVASPTHLTSFLLKPFQRLSKYPLLLKELRDKGDLSEEFKADITIGMEAAQVVLQASNEAIDLDDRRKAVIDLKGRVEDWKGHKIEGFGDLLLHGTHTVLKGDGTTKDSEREYKVYLFEMILLCCKEMKPNKQKYAIAKRSTVDASGRARLQLKGRIFMQNVTETISIQKPGSYTCQIFWKGDPGIENFVIRFQTEEQMKKWAHMVDKQRRAWKDTPRPLQTRQGTATSATEFVWTGVQGQMENPYRQDDDEDEGDDDETEQGYGGQSDYSASRNGSSTSLRSRSTTGESGPPMTHNSTDPRIPPARFPMLPTSSSNQNLTLRTQQLQAQEGGPNDSYFSPVVETPASSRTSASSNMFPFPRQGTPNNGHYSEENQNRFTAPAMSRNTPPNGYAPRNRPSMPPNAGSQQSRFRSASSPDIQNNGLRRAQSEQQAPPVPNVPNVPFPIHHAYAPGVVNRSQSNSPINAGQSNPATSGSRMPSRNIPSAIGRTVTPAYDSRTISPPPPSATPQQDNFGIPSQLRVKVICPSAGTSMTLVIPTNISYQSLKDRIDAKLQRSTNVSLATGQVSLKFLDDDDYVSIDSDEDVQTAFETWREQHQHEQVGQIGEIELYCT